jgi:hypothetical protein
MELTPEERTRIYNEEKARLEAQQQIQAEQEQAQHKKNAGWARVGGAVLAGIILLLCVLGAFPKTTDKPGDNKRGAYRYSREFVERRLKEPSSAKFCDYDESKVVSLGGDMYRVNSCVDSQNSFGAMIRNNYTCKLRTIEDKWYLDDLDIGSE